MHPPHYFNSIRNSASKRWNQLESDEELARPWRLLFEQIQSPRHVVSELLQNADDAGATEASVEIKDGEFIFCHNGEDFTREQFASLCSFGYSNKRTLHTIGFRGVGFKSTFSLGDEVRLVTPTLSVTFHEQRFTEPVWTESAATNDGRTEIRVVIRNEDVQKELDKNLHEWSQSPTSLIFFNHIRCLRVQEREIRLWSHGDGPVDDSEWISISNRPGTRYLAIRSLDEEFPEDALQEIRNERRTQEDDIDSPTFRIEIILGIEGRLFVVLPTGVLTQLPFACNAPFIQDPARMKIKDPALSPTNRWLLKRTGELAAKAMLGWLGNQSREIGERAQAYSLFPDVNREDGSIEGRCGAIVKQSFEARIEGEKFLLTEADILEPLGNCLAVPSELLTVWSAEQVSAAFGSDNPSILSRHINEKNRNKLLNWGHVDILKKSDVLVTLKSTRLPRPQSWIQLLNLWAYVSDKIVAPWFYHRNIRILPVQGEEKLYAAHEIVRLGPRLPLERADWEFLAPHLLTIDPNWTDFLSNQARSAEADNDEALKRRVQLAYQCISILGLNDSTNVGRVMKNVADSFFAQGSSYKISDCVRLAHIAAKLKAAVPHDFRFVTRERRAKPAPVLSDLDNDLGTFVDVDWYRKNVLHGAYAEPSATCTFDEWRKWVGSDGSRLYTFVPLLQTEKGDWRRDELTEELRRRGMEGEPYFHYKRDNFIVTDWNFATAHWQHWSSLAEEDDRFWSRLMTRILEQPQSFWSKAKSARADQTWSNNARRVTQEPLLPTWILRLRDLPCLPDTLGRPRHPAELLLRTPDTEPLLNVESFVKADLDTETTRSLLILLGVSDKPTGPERLLERLRALADSETPFVPEVQKWCNSLDQLFDGCSSEEAQVIKTAFADGKLILTDQEEWAGTDEVFLNPDQEGLLETTLIHPALRELTVWRKIGVAEYPTEEMEIEWLKNLPAGEKLTPARTRRIRHLLGIYPGRVWRECEHWLNLAGDWIPTSSLEYCLTTQSLVSWSHLFPAVKATVADFRHLSSEACQSYPLSTLPRLADAVEERFQRQSGLAQAQVRPWIIALGRGLKRIVLDDAEQTRRVRAAARRLEQTKWQVAGGMESMPYINGKPAGTSRTMEASWQGDALYVQNSSPARMAKAVSQEVGRAFENREIVDAVKLCYERNEDFIDECLDSSFDLAPLEEIEPALAPDEPAENAEVPANVLPKAGGGLHIAGDGASDGPNRGKEGDEATRIAEPGDGAQLHETVRRQRVPHPSLIERFAKSHGFLTGSNGRFLHADGRRLEKTHQNAFPWELRSTSGILLRYYWPSEHCIQHEPLQLRADIWDLCERYPERYSLILTDVTGAPVEIPGSQLVKMRELGMLDLFPATYRLKYTGKGNLQPG